MDDWRVVKWVASWKKVFMFGRHQDIYVLNYTKFMELDYVELNR